MLGTLLLAVLVTSVVLGYARHTVVAASNIEAAVAVQRAESAADSGLAWARQALLADAVSSATLTIDDDSEVTVAVAGGGAGVHALTIESSVSGVSQVMEGQVETYASVGGSLPQLTSAAKSALQAHGSVTNVSGTVSYSNQTLGGILYLRSGARLTLTNCIVTGSIVSEPGVRGTWTPSDRTTLTLAGTVVIESDAALSGCSIIAPDCTVSGAGGEAVQIQGAVVCDTLALGGWGAIHGLIATASAPALASGVDLPGAGREPRSWPSAIDPGAQRISRLSFPRAEAEASEQQAIEDFTFPADGGG